MCKKTAIINKSHFGSLTRCSAGKYHFQYNQLHWIFSNEELTFLIKVVQNIVAKDWEYSPDTATWIIKIPILFENKILYLFCTQIEFDHLYFILNGYKINEEKIEHLNRKLIYLN